MILIHPRKGQLQYWLAPVLRIRADNARREAPSNPHNPHLGQLNRVFTLANLAPSSTHPIHRPVAPRPIMPTVDITRLSALRHCVKSIFNELGPWYQGIIALPARKSWGASALAPWVCGSHGRSARNVMRHALRSRPSRRGATGATRPRRARVRQNIHGTEFSWTQNFGKASSPIFRASPYPTPMQKPH